MREFLTNSLRNTPRQNRGCKRFCKDLSVLIAEGNYTDETILGDNRLELRKYNTVGLLLSIKMTLTFMVRQMNQLFNLEMVRLEELPFILMQLSYIYQMKWAN